MKFALRQLQKLSIYNNQAFSLIELLVTMSLLGIILAIAVPNMTGLFESSQATSQAHDFVSAVQYTLQESGKQNANVTVCAKKATSDECVTYTSSPASDIWRNGWLIFLDSNNNGIYEPSSDTLLKTQVNSTNKVTVIAPSSAVTISADGVVTRGQGTYYFHPIKCTVSTGHRVIVYKSGQLSTKGGICP